MCTAFEEVKKGYIELRDTTHGVGALMYDPDDADGTLYADTRGDGVLA